MGVVGDSAENFISIHALGRESLLVLFFDLTLNPLKMTYSARWETIEFMSLFSTHQPPK